MSAAGLNQCLLQSKLARSHEHQVVDRPGPALACLALNCLSPAYIIILLAWHKWNKKHALTSIRVSTFEHYNGYRKLQRAPSYGTQRQLEFICRCIVASSHRLSIRKFSCMHTCDSDRLKDTDTAVSTAAGQLRSWPLAGRSNQHHANC